MRFATLASCAAVLSVSADVPQHESASRTHTLHILEDMEADLLAILEAEDSAFNDRRFFPPEEGSRYLRRTC